MRRRSAQTLLAAVAATLLLPVEAGAEEAIAIGAYSQKATPDTASIGASINVSTGLPGRPAAEGDRGAGGGGNAGPPAYPTLSSDSSRLRDATPAGPDSFWYRDPSGNPCIYLPDSVTPCYNVVAPGGGQPAGPAVDPVALAMSAARRLDLSVGRIVASPSARAAGLTGAASWFWLEPGPEARAVSVSLAGERVTVTAGPDAVEWRFGDGAVRQGGPGRPYRRGQPPEGSVRHRYETRCLPGDQGRNPYVLASCGSDGYRVEAAVAWAISFRATGPVSASGTLPDRTTETSIEYPVSEARGFLASGDGQ